MEFLEEHDNLRRKYSKEDSMKERTDKLNKNMSNYNKDGSSVNNTRVELTPNANRKNSDFLIHELQNNMNSMISDKNNSGVLFIGICGGQSSGKSLISLYIKKHIKNCILISEKDFFIGNTADRRKSEENKGKFTDLNKQDEGEDFPIARKQRLIDTNNIKNFDIDGMKKVIASIKEGKQTKVQGWDKDKNCIIPEKYLIEPKNLKIVILEGQFIFYLNEIRDALNYRIFVETDDDIRLARMVIKENIYIKDKHVALKTFFTVYEECIKPCYQKYIEATKKYAHLILPNFSFSPSLEINETSVLDFLVLNLHNINNKKIV